MAEALRLIGPGNGLQFELDLREDRQRGALAWGYGRLRLQRWQNRQERLHAEAARLHSGLSPAALERLVGDKAASAFWEIDAADPTADTVILAAARMSAGHVDSDTQRILLEELRALPNQETDMF